MLSISSWPQGVDGISELSIKLIGLIIKAAMDIIITYVLLKWLDHMYNQPYCKKKHCIIERTSVLYWGILV